jgi:hypothetical protein
MNGHSRIDTMSHNVYFTTHIYYKELNNDTPLVGHYFLMFWYLGLIAIIIMYILHLLISHGFRFVFNITMLHYLTYPQLYREVFAF